jgi:hypothetical protein
MAKASKGWSLEAKVGRCAIAIMAGSPKNRPHPDPAERERIEWLRRRIDELMTKLYGSPSGGPPAAPDKPF